MNDKSIEQRIEKFNAMPIFRKARILGAAEAMERIYNEEAAVVESFTGRCCVVGIINDIAIVETTSFKEAPYQAAVKVNGKWQRLMSCWNRLEKAMLDAIDYKYNKSHNSQFAYYASKMVGIDNDGGDE